MGYKLLAIPAPVATHSPQHHTPSHSRAATTESNFQHPIYSLSTFAKPSYTHLILASTRSTTTLAVRIGQLLAISNKNCKVGVIAPWISPSNFDEVDTGISGDFPQNLKILAQPVFPRALCMTFHGESRIQGIKLDDQGDHMVGCMREFIVCCDPTTSLDSIFPMLESLNPGTTPPVPDFRNGLGHGKPAGLKDLRVAPIVNHQEADIVAGWMLEDFANDLRR